MTNKKAQASVEFLIILSAALILFLITFSIISFRDTEYLYKQMDIEAEFYADKLSETINQVFVSGPGSEASYYLPGQLSDGTYINLTVYPEKRFIEARWLENSYITHFNTKLETAQTSFTSGFIKIYSTEDGVYVE